MSFTKGCWKIGNKDRNEVDEVHVTSSKRPSEVLRQEYYVLSGMQPNLNDLPWEDDLTAAEKRKIEKDIENAK